MTEQDRENVNREFARRSRQTADREAVERELREAAAAEAERERREANEAVAPFLADAENRRQQRELEKQRRMKAEEEARRAEGRAGLEDFACQRLNLWMSNGGTEEGFREAWPSMQREYMAEREAERRKLIQEGRVF